MTSQSLAWFGGAGSMSLLNFPTGQMKRHTTRNLLWFCTRRDRPDESLPVSLEMSSSLPRGRCQGWGETRESEGSFSWKTKHERRYINAALFHDSEDSPNDQTFRVVPAGARAKSLQGPHQESISFSRVFFSAIAFCSYTCIFSLAGSAGVVPTAVEATVPRRWSCLVENDLSIARVLRPLVAKRGELETEGPEITI